MFILSAMLIATGPAHAAWPDDVSLSSMLEHDGDRVLQTGVLGDSYRQLIKEMGTMASNKPITPAETLGVYGWDIGIYDQFIFIEAHDRGTNSIGSVSPWDRAHEEEEAPPYLHIPTLGVRKGLPFSTEVGMNLGWIVNTNTGIVSGWGRVAVIEGYKPVPDISLQLGYSGYVGNDELELSVLDLNVTVGSTYYTGSLPGINTAKFSPWFTYSTLRISAHPLLDEDTATGIGAVYYQAGTVEEGFRAPIVLPQFGGGMQIIARNIHLRLGATWTPATIPTAIGGMGLTF